MADFGINSTQLSDPKGEGTQPLSPVQEQVSKLGPSPIFGAIGDIFAKGLVQNRKDQAEARKNAIIGEYVNNQKVYDDALTSGQWNSSQTAIASRANYTKMLAAYPEYAEDLKNARSAFYGGSETGEAQRKLDAENKQRESDIAAASSMGYTFYPGMSEQAQNANLEAYRAARRVEYEFDTNAKRAAEERAARGDARAEGSYQMSVSDYVAKEAAVQGAREVAGKNFDLINASATDLLSKVAGGMSSEEALAIHGGNISRIKAGLLAIAGKSPDMAAPWIKLFDDMDANIRAQLDPNKKSADELKRLQDQFQILVTQGKLAAVQRDPRLLKAVVATQLFQGEGMVTLANAPVVKDWLLNASGADPSLGAAPQIVGTKDDAQVFKSAKDAINNLQSGKVQNVEKATQEATNIVNTLLDQTTKANGEMNPAALKQASAFFASPEFGRLALAGKVDKQTAANAQHVFQVQYEPKVKEAIVNRLQESDIANHVNVKVIGSQVVFERTKPSNVGAMEALSNFSIDRGMRGIDGVVGVAALKEAEAGLNQLVRLHAHLEGTTDYAKYWETHKHELMPSIYPDPNRLKPGQVVDGFKYIGGNYRDRSNWIAEPAKPAAGSK